MTAKKRAQPRDAYDSVLKEAIAKYLASFLALLFPKAWEQVDWSRPPEQLDTELRKVVHDARSTDHRVDQLFKVYLKEGGERFVLAHIEMQTMKDRRLAKRMFGYCLRIYDRYQVPVAGFVALGDETKNKEGAQPEAKHDHFGWEALGSEMSWKFQSVRLMDWESRWQELLASRNPFAIIVMAYIRTKSTRRSPTTRLGWKLQIARHLHEIHPEEEVASLVRLLDWLMTLPEEQAIIFSEEIEALQTEFNMSYIPSFTRESWEKGLAEGRKEGRQEGHKEGHKEGLVESLERLLQRRFGVVPEPLKARLESIGDPVRLQQLFDAALDAKSISQLEAALAG